MGKDMRISGFTIARNVIKYNYPVIQSIKSILPICDEFIVNVGDSEDNTLEFIQSIGSPKIKLIQSTWDMSQGKEVLSNQTNIALKACIGDWAFYLQSDEVIHEKDLKRLKNVMKEHLNDSDADALRFKWLHFYGSYFRYRIDKGWYQKQDRIIRNNGQVESYGDAYAFRRKDGRPLKNKHTKTFLYHYGWVQTQEIMASRRQNAENIGFIELKDDERANKYFYGDLNRFPVYFGKHPKVMDERIKHHSFSQDDWSQISQKYWWSPLKMLRIRYKTFKRVKDKIV